MSGLEAKPYLRTIFKRPGAPGGYPFSLPTIRNFSSMEFHPDVTFFVGENGTGKSTLLEAIAVRLGLNAEGGTQNARFSNRDTHSDLFKFLHTDRSFRRAQEYFFLRAESLYNLSSYFEDTFGEDTEHYQVTRDFLNNYRGMLDVLLGDDEPS